MYTHGGDLRRMAQHSNHAPETLLDFSVNVRPEGAPDFIQTALWQAMHTLERYPSPHAEEALDVAARYHHVPAEHFVFGNGSNDLIHALVRTLARSGIQRVYLIEPAFSEYALACRNAGLPITRIASTFSSTNAHVDTPLWALPDTLPPHSAIMLANPGNPSGQVLSRIAFAALLERYPDTLWIVDEAFIHYVGDDAEVSLLPYVTHKSNLVILRSLTKFYAVPSLRLGYAITNPSLAARLQDALPAWSINGFALAAACAVFTDHSEFMTVTRQNNSASRDDLCTQLARLEGIRIIPSAANYVLFQWENAPDNLLARLLTEHGIAIRDCANYHGLDTGHWFRAAVRLPEEHRRLVSALQAVQHTSLQRSNTPSSVAPSITPLSASETDAQTGVPTLLKPRPTPALMLQGTSSNAGKSVLAAAFCRILHQDGYAVAPFKAQNMSLNSGVTLAGDEMGRAQIVQAQACCCDPDARMNPILLKPHSETGSQVVVLGKAIGHMNVKTYYNTKQTLWKHVTQAYDSLAAEHEVMVLEGAGSPAEVNLKHADVVNMRMAAHAKASVLLVGDIDRGGVYASFLGTWMTFTAQERALLKGFLVNRFRGDASLLASAHDYLHQRTQTPVLGVVPYVRDLNLPEEDMAGFVWERSPTPTPAAGMLDVAVIMLGHVSNYTDVAPLGLEPDVCLRPVRQAEEWGTPHVVIIPGSKSVVADLKVLRESGLADRLSTHAAQGGWVFGICGGLQIMGQRILDPHGVESSLPEVAGLGLLDLCSTFAKEKTLLRVARANTPLGVPSGGYEIHHGYTQHGADARPLFQRQQADEHGETVCGYVTERRWATYLHGIFDDDAFRRAFLDHVRADVGLAPQGQQLVSCDLERSLDRLAQVVRDSVDMNTLYRHMGLR